ncbi:MAG TPA: hypothetical protein V6D20_21770 [Candidatus Obscuribacterales bacterium]
MSNYPNECDALDGPADLSYQVWAATPIAWMRSLLEQQSSNGDRP